MKIIRGKVNGSDCKIAIVLSLFNEFIGQKLLEAALSALKENGVDEDAIDLIKVPGAFELAVTADKLASSSKYNAIICLGSVIRGDTPHFEYVSGAAANGILNVSLKYGIPVMFGVLTTNTIEQAIERSGGKDGNKGKDVALAALEMINIMKKLNT